MVVVDIVLKLFYGFREEVPSCLFISTVYYFLYWSLMHLQLSCCWFDDLYISGSEEGCLFNRHNRNSHSFGLWSYRSCCLVLMCSNIEKLLYLFVWSTHFVEHFIVVYSPVSLTDSSLLTFLYDVYSCSFFYLYR